MGRSESLNSLAGNLEKFDGRGTFVKITVASLWILICCIKGLKQDDLVLYAR